MGKFKANDELNVPEANTSHMIIPNESDSEDELEMNDEH